MRIKIDCNGPPASGKTTALILIRKALQERFDIKPLNGLEMTSTNEHYLEIECYLKDQD